MIQRHGAIVICSCRNVSEVSGGQPGSRQGFKLRDIEHLVDFDSGGIGDRICSRQPETETRHAEQCRSQAQAAQQPTAR
jgi:hypothetical protein